MACVVHGLSQQFVVSSQGHHGDDDAPTNRSPSTPSPKDKARRAFAIGCHWLFGAPGQDAVGGALPVNPEPHTMNHVLKTLKRFGAETIVWDHFVSPEP